MTKPIEVLKPIVLPKDYLSWSQINLWETSKNQYIKRYFEDQPGFSNKYMRYGSKVGGALEKQDFFGMSEKEQQALVQIDRADFYELKIDSKKEGLKMPYDCLMFIDAAFGTLDKITRIDEYKTGKEPWTQERVNDHGQLDFYALGIYKLFGKIPKVNLVWIETEERLGEIQATGRVEIFKRKITKSDLNAMEKRINYVATEISEAYEKWQFSTDEGIDKDRVQLFVELMVQIKDFKEQADELKAKIQQDVENSGLTKYEHEAGSFYFTERKNYELPIEIKELEMKFKEAKKEAQKKATPTITKSFTFKGKF